MSINRLRTLRVLRVVHQHRKLRSEHLLAMLVIVALPAQRHDSIGLEPLITGLDHAALTGAGVVHQISAIADEISVGFDRA